jgi:hypothetical protein
MTAREPFRVPEEALLRSQVPVAVIACKRGRSFAADQTSSPSGNFSSSHPRNLLNGRTRSCIAKRADRNGEIDSAASRWASTLSPLRWFFVDR